MSTTFEDNTEVTLADLNNVAIDLGHTDFSAFSTEKFGVDKLNQITSDLVSAGVLRTGENGALGCEVVLSNGKAYVQAGVIVFESGAKIRITEPVGIDIVPGTSIYAFYDSTTGRASLEASEATPSGNYVLLAEVDAEGTIADRRSSCVAKVLMTADTQNVYREFTVTIASGEYSTEIDVLSNNFSYIFLIGVRVNSSNNESVTSYIANLNNMLLSGDGESIEFSYGYSSRYSEGSVSFNRVGQHITVGEYTYDGRNREVTFMVI